MVLHHKIFLVMLVTFLLDTGFVCAEQTNSRGRNELAIEFDAGLSYGGGTDRFDVYFDVPVAGLSTASFFGRFGFEAVTHNGFSARLLAGYDHVFYSSIGIQQIYHSYFTTDLLFSYYFKKQVKHWDPYVVVGPKMRIGNSGAQGYMNVGAGIRYFLNDTWSLRFEPVALTDFDGVWGQASAGVGLHF